MLTANHYTTLLYNRIYLYTFHPKKKDTKIVNCNAILLIIYYTPIHTKQTTGKQKQTT